MSTFMTPNEEGSHSPRKPESVEDYDGHLPDENCAGAELKFNLAPGSRLLLRFENRSEKEIANLECRISDGVVVSIEESQIEGGRATFLPDIQSVWKKIRRFFSRPVILSDHLWQNSLFIIALVIYLATRLIGLEDFPIFFFTDEAVQAVLATDFIRDGFHNYAGEFLPTFFENNTLLCLSTSVYLQVIPVAIFGKSVYVTRAVAALVTVLAAVWCSLILRDIFKLRIWWSGALFLSVTPAWFLHSRTAFEYGLLVTFYAGFFYYYWLYRCRNPRYLYPSLVCGALAFYSYMPGQVIMVFSGLLLLSIDWRYHWENRRIGIRGMMVLLLLVLPFIRFLINHPDEMVNRLNRYRSYWQEAIPISEKLTHYLSEYFAGLNPFYWFIANDHELSRHMMKGYGHVLWPMLFLTLVGLVFVIKRYRKVEARPLLVALLAAPSGSAMIALGITRALVMVIPLAILSALGVSELLNGLGKKIKNSQISMELVLFVILAGLNLYMLRDALVNAPLWYDNYGLTGMQYGARQVFSLVEDYLEKEPDIKIDVSPTWTNGADIVARFFLSDPLPIQMASIDGYMNQYRSLTDDNLFVMTSSEYEKTVASSKFRDIIVEKILPYPDGSPGFYFVRLQYVDDIVSILEKEREQRRQLIESDAIVSGHPAIVKYSYLDMGGISNLFDNNDQTIARTMEANPMVVAIEFLDPISLEQVTIRVGGGPTRVTLKLTTASGESLPVLRDDLPSVPNPRDVAFQIETDEEIISAIVQVQNLDVGEPSHVHVWEIQME